MQSNQHVHTDPTGLAVSTCTGHTHTLEEEGCHSSWQHGCSSALLLRPQLLPLVSLCRRSLQSAADRSWLGQSPALKVNLSSVSDRTKDEKSSVTNKRMGL